MGCPPEAAIAAVEPVLVETHIPDDHTFKLCLTSYDTPAKRVLASLGNVDESSSSFDNHPRRKRDTAPGLGFAINKSFSAGTRRVSEKVDLTLQRIRVRFDKLSCSHPRNTPRLKIALDLCLLKGEAKQNECTNFNIFLQTYLFFSKYDRCNRVFNIQCGAHAKSTVRSVQKMITQGRKMLEAEGMNETYTPS